MGDWVDDEKRGFGIITLPSGDKYEGDFLNDFANGKGILISAVNSSAGLPILPLPG